MRQLIRSLAVVLALGGLINFAAPLTPVAHAAGGCEKSMLGFPPWYKGLTKGSDCSIVDPGSYRGGIEGFITKIALNVVNILLVLIIYIAVGFIIYGGYMYLINAGNANRISAAKSLILNAVIGLVIAIMSAAIVGFVAGRL